jgi:hypothetical protein
MLWSFLDDQTNNKQHVERNCAMTCLSRHSGMAVSLKERIRI